MDDKSIDLIMLLSARFLCGGYFLVHFPGTAGYQLNSFAVLFFPLVSVQTIYIC